MGAIEERTPIPYLQAGTNTPFGLSPVAAAGVEPQTNAYAVSTSSGEILIGDLCLMTTILPGFVRQASLGTSAVVTGTGAVGQVAGVAAESKAANVGGTILLYDDPDQIYVCQDNGNSTAGLGSSAAVIGNSFTLDCTATGGPVSAGRSSMVFMATAGASGIARGDRPILVLGIHPIENLTGTAAYQTASGQPKKWRVKLNGLIANNEVRGS